MHFHPHLLVGWKVLVVDPLSYFMFEPLQDNEGDVFYGIGKEQRGIEKVLKQSLPTNGANYGCQKIRVYPLVI